MQKSYEIKIRIGILFILLAWISSGYANEGIQFSNGTWKEILIQAKKENKIIFIDVYTTWCVPCKKMAAEVFPKKEVADLFNSSFINYKIDAEKGEGISIAKIFRANAYPTYLFVNGNGQLIYKSIGYMPASDFLKEAALAIKEANDPKPLAKWEEEYTDGKRNKDFLIAYFRKRQAIQLSSAELIDEIIPLLTKAELKNAEIMSPFLTHGLAVQFVPQGALYKYITKNYQQIDSIFQLKVPSLLVLQAGISSYISKNVIAAKDESKLKLASESMKEVSLLLNDPQAEARSKKIAFELYAGDNDEEKFNTSVVDYVENGLFRNDPEKMIAENKSNFDKFMEPYLSGKQDSLKLAGWEMNKKISRIGIPAINFSYSLRDAAEAVYRKSKDKKVLTVAMEWARQANEIFPHFSSGGVYAGLLYINGKTAEAIQLLQFLIANNSNKALLFKENIEKMKKGEVPGNLWR